MSEIEQIIAEERKILGTGNSRAIRKEGKVPGILYGDKKEPTLISIDNKIIKKLLEKPGFFSRQFEIKIGNNSQNVLAKDLQLHPVNESIIHLDFLRVGESTKVTVSIPVKFINENLCEGLKKGGVINIVRHEIEVKSLVTKIPPVFEVDLNGLDIGDSIHISSIKLDKDVKPTISDRDFTIATIAPPTVIKVEEEKPEDDSESKSEEESTPATTEENKDESKTDPEPKKE
tara:strand:+ start:132 stop:824 length:693 start_codon:yes stop_codon:yes gene_type:complete